MPGAATGSNVVSVLTVVFFFLSCALSSVIFISFISLPFFYLSSLMKGVVWRGWMTSLLCLFRTRVLSDAEGRGIVDEPRTETACGVASYQAD